MPDLPLSPREVFAHIQQATLHGGAITELYAEDAVHEWPFPLPTAPRRLVGRKQISAFFDRIRTGGAGKFDFEEFTNVAVHDTGDPETIVAEYDIRGSVIATGRPFVFSYVLVLRVRDGQIVSVRDYLNPHAMSQALVDRSDAAGPSHRAVATPPASHLDLLERPLFAHVATLRPDGSPQSNVMWFGWDGTVVELTHSRRGQKFRNLTHHPALALSIADPDNPYRYLEVRGDLARVDDDREGIFFTRLAQRYRSPTRLDAGQLEHRVRLVVQPSRFHAIGD